VPWPLHPRSAATATVQWKHVLLTHGGDVMGAMSLGALGRAGSSVMAAVSLEALPTLRLANGQLAAVPTPRLAKHLSGVAWGAQAFSLGVGWRGVL
jgi:hypothetical protein